MTKSYYTSLCRAWLDHEILICSSSEEKLIEMLGTDKDDERICEWIIDQLQETKEHSSTSAQLLKNITEIDFLKISEALSEEYSVI